MAAKSAHVLKNIAGGWGVQKSGAERASKVFDSKERAIEHARALAKREGASLYIHNADGTIKSVAPSTAPEPVATKLRPAKSEVGHSSGHQHAAARAKKR